jgi:acyl transferase domain-containing protein/glutamate-1-semialdehyde aminotransferase
VSSTSTPTLEPIAVIAMAGRFPGAPTLDRFWQNLREGVESIARFTEADLRAAGVDEVRLRDARYVNAGAVLSGAELFDAEFFGYLPREAARLDPQHRLFLECAWEVLESAGYDPDRYAGTIGVFGGVATNSYLVNHLCPSSAFGSERASFETMVANDKDYVTTRVAYELNLRGPALTLQTACSTALVAVHVACQSLWSFQCDMAMAGAAAVRCPPASGYLHTEGMILSPDGHTRTFDANAAGTVMGSGAGLVLLKRLSDALADGDPILALIKSSAVNNDGGSKAGYTAPSVPGQAEVISLAHQLAAINADSISFVEAHGTATAVGDPIELAALTRAFRATTSARRFCAIGSVKTNIGHADAASGMAGLIKTVLALVHRELPPSLHFERPNPAIDFENSPFYVNTALVPWQTKSLPRRAGVSAFGIGGTNAHVILEEAPPRQDRPASPPWHLVILSARTPAALEAMTDGLASAIAARPDLDMADAAWTLQVGRKAFPCRRAVVVRDGVDAVDVLAKRPPSRVMTAMASPRPKVIFLFPGQGAQHPNMARELFEREPVFRDAFMTCARQLAPHLGVDLTTIVYPDDETCAAPASSPLGQTLMAQPALFAVEYALSVLLKSWGVQPDAMIGHSLGEYVAACLAGVMSLEDALALVAARARLMQAQPRGAMLAVPLAEDRLQPRLDKALCIAAVNGPTQCVVSGAFEDIDRLARVLGDEGIVARVLPTSHAFHSPMMQPAAEAFFDRVTAIRLEPPRTPFIANVTGTWITAEQATDPRYWCEQLRRTVRLADGVRTVLETGDCLWLEAGPGRTLGALVRQQGGTCVQSSVSSRGDRSARQHLLEAVGALWAHGATIEWPQPNGERRACRVALPTYPFERRRHWIDPPAGIAAAAVRAVPEAGETPFERAPVPAISTADPDPRPPVSDLEATLVGVLQQISGLDARAIDMTASFLDLGFDSLLLTQAALAVRQTCGVQVSLRHLLGETPSVRSLAAMIARESAGAVPPPPAAPPPSGRDAQAPTPDAVATPAVMAGNGIIERHAGIELTAAQRRHLDAFIARYTRRTAGSKRLTHEYRRYHADPRTAAGFNPIWKELVYPIVVTRSAGSRIWDVDGNEYIDLLNGFGPNFLGHASPIVMDALRTQLERGIELGPQLPLAGEVARLVCELTGMDRVSFVNTGSEAVQAAIRVARTVTGRKTIVLFSGDYHGNFDEVLVRAAHDAGRHAAVPSAPGIPPEAVANVLVLEYGAPRSLDILRARAAEIAGVLVEPIQSRRPERQPAAFVRELRQITRETGMVLIFDEVITGFRMGPGGAQAFYGIQADLATYGKVAGGGMPIGMVAGRAELMDTFDGGQWNYGDDSVPDKGVTFFAGTFIRHPLAMAAALATLTYLKQQGPDLWRHLDERTARLAGALDAVAVAEDLPIRVPWCSSLFFVRVSPDQKLANLLFHHLRDRGVYLQEGFPSYLTLAHSEADVDRVIDCFKDSVAELQAAGVFAPARPTPRFALTEAQQEIWMATRLGPLASAAYNESCVLRLTGALDVPILRRALADIVARHEAFRTAIEPDGAMQCVVPVATLPLDEVSASTAERLDELLARDSLTPFDLERPPLARATLIRLGPESHHLVFTAHHLVCDGWSTTHLLSELGARYSALVEDPTAPPLPPATAFRTLVDWHATHDRSPASAAEERYWLDHLAGDLPAIALPLDRPHPTERTFRARREELTLDAGLIERLRRLSTQAGCTLVTTQLAVFEVLLHRLTGQSDFIVGLPAAEHTVLGTRDIVGHATNLLPLRVTIDARMPFATHLQRVKTALLDAADHRHCTYGRLLRQLRCARSPGRLPLVDVIFNIDRLDDALGFRGLDVTLVDNERHAFTFDLGLNCVQTERTVLVQGDYNADVFDGETIRRWLSHYRTLLDAVVERPALAVGALPLLTETERRQQLVDWNQPPVGHMP